MSDEEQFWRASEIHAHQWILIFSEPVPALRSPCFARIFVCPVCGNAWGKRAYKADLSLLFQSIDRPCSIHNGGGLTKGSDYDRSGSDDFNDFAITQFIIDPSVIHFHD